MVQYRAKLKDKLYALVTPEGVDRELAWRAYVLNTVLLALILFTFFCLVLILVFWLLGLEDNMAVVAALIVLTILTATYRVSRKKSVPVAIYMFSAVTIAMSFFLSLGWGITDISTNAFYVMSIVENSLLVRGKYFFITLGGLVSGYFLLGLAELNGLYTPPFHTDLQANYILVTLILLFLTFLGFVTARLIDQVLSAQVQEATRRQQLESRTKIAAEVQLKMLPTEAPVRPDYEIAGQSIPAREVGGDFYNYHQLPSGTLAVTIGDVTGKGMPAALLMAVITGMIDSVIPGVSEPRELLTIVGAQMHRHSNQSGLQAACQVAFFTGDRRLVVANAGCIAPAIYRNNGVVEWLNVGGLPMGVDMSLANYQQVEMDLNEGDWIIFTTDGVVECQNGPGKMLGFEALEKIIIDAPTYNPQTLRSHIINGVRQFQGDKEQHDDITVVVVRVKENNVNAA